MTSLETEGFTCATSGEMEFFFDLCSESPYSGKSSIYWPGVGRVVGDMPFMFIGSTGDRAGHSLVTWTVARRLMENGANVGFVKPFGSHAIQKQGLLFDHDALLFKEVLGLQEPYDRICPYPTFGDTWRNAATDGILKELKSVTRESGKGKDVLLIMGSEKIFFDDAPFPLPEISIIPELKADILLISRFRTISKSVYSILSITSLLKDHIKGIILNRIPPEKLEEIRSRLMPSLVQKGIPMLAAIPEDPFLSRRSIREIVETLDGEILCREGDMNSPINGMTVGSSDLTGSLTIFKRVYNKIVLLKAVTSKENLDKISGPRPVGGILLTGGRHPAPQLLQAARHASIPLAGIKDDTFSALEKLESTPSVLSIDDEAKVLHFSNLLDRDGALDNLVGSLLLP